MKNLVRKGFPGTSSTLPSPSVNRGNSGKSKNITSKVGATSVLPSTKPARSNKRGGPAGTPKGGGISSGGGSFGQK